MPAMAKESKHAVVTALTANVAIAGSKFVAAAITGSAAMLAEAVHSATDSGNQVLMLVGMRRSRRPPDASHPFGHGKGALFLEPDDCCADLWRGRRDLRV